MKKTVGVTAKGKGLLRSLNRKGSDSGKGPAMAARVGGTPPPSVCEQCGAVFSRRTWRRGRKVTGAFLGGAKWSVCPSCKQVRDQEYFGRVMIRGAYAGANEEAIRQRIQNVAERAGFTQPQRRLISINRDGADLEVLTTSQKLAHRIVRELQKAFRGKASYAWSASDGALFATWQRDDVPAAKVAGRR